MRDVNEGDLSFSTLVRSSDRALSRMETSGQRFVHRRRRHLCGAAGRARSRFPASGRALDRRPRGAQHGHGRRQSVRARAVRRFRDRAARARRDGAGPRRLRPRETPIEEFLAARERSFSALVLSVSLPRPASPEAFRYRKIARVKPKGGSVLTIAAHLPTERRPRHGARIAFGSMGATPLRAKSAERALEGRPLERRDHRRRRRRRARRPGAGRRRAGERLVSARSRGRASAPPAERRGVKR